MPTHFRQHKTFTAVGILAAALLLVLLGIIIFSEPLLRWLVVDQGEKRLGREIELENLDINWRWTYTAVHAENIRIANAPDYPEPDMMTIDVLDLTFNPLKLLVGKLEFGEITLDKLNLLLHKKSQDDTNWNLAALEQNNDEATLAENRHQIPLIEQLQLKDGKVIYRDAVRGLNLDLDLNSVIGEGRDEESGMSSGNGFEITGTGSVQEQNFEIEVAGDSLETLRDTTREFPLSLKIIMGDTRLSLEGTFEDPIKLTGVDATLKISGSNMADLYFLTAIPLPPTTPYTFNGTLQKEGDVWSSTDFAMVVGASDLSGDLSFDTGEERGFFQADLVSNVLDSRDLGGFIGLDPAAQDPFPDDESEEHQDPDGKIIPDVPLALDRLRATDLDVTLKADEINAPNVPFKGLKVRFNLRDGHLTLDPLIIALADGTIEGVIDIKGQEDVPPMKIDLNIKNIRLGRFFDGTRFADTTEGVFGGTVALAGTGASLADVLARSNGEMTIIMADGTISRLLIEASELDLAGVIPLFFGSDKSTHIRCGVIDFEVTNGILTSKIFVFDTENSTLLGDMNIDMRDEQINATLEAEPKDGSPLSAQTPLIVSGTLKNPSMGFDAKKGLARGAAAVALGALLTPFAAILAFVNTGDGEDSNCSALINEATQ